MAVLVSISSCSSKKNAPDALSGAAALRQVLPDSTETAALDGNNLAHVYCSACHQFPEPALLPKAVWENQVLPAMGLRLGIGVGLNLYTTMSPYEIAALLTADIFPDKALIAKKDWLKIMSYYKAQAPDTLPKPKPLVLTPLTSFEAKPLAINKGKYALTSLLKYEPLTKEILVGDRRNKLFRLNNQLQAIDSIQVDTPPVAITASRPGEYKVITIGSMQPSDSKFGRLYSWQVATNKSPAIAQPLITGLQRPVQLATGDLNNDEREDLVVCQYGNQLGALTWHESTPDGQYKEHLLKRVPGSQQVMIRDLNHDNLPDIVVLFAQGTESVIAFYNQGNGQFTEETLLQLPPVYGASYFDLADFNKDGAPDILLSNGDNADYSFTLKPYHGVRIFLNNKQNKFRETSFLTLPGASKALARDFDQDGDLDIAAIAFFADFEKQPEAGFVYYENQGNNTFKAESVPEVTKGRWLTLDAGDVDQDGDEDILLGSFIFAATPVPNVLQADWAKNSPSVLVLKNSKVKTLASK